MLGSRAPRSRYWYGSTSIALSGIVEFVKRSSAGRAFLGGLWIGNGLPHLISGVVDRNYSCKLGNAPAPNLVAGVVALTIAPLFFGPVRSPDIKVARALAGLGATVSLVIHAQNAEKFQRQLN